jgi:uncharacterized membrane protein YeaQ/YmgE (transglycosylase-associated protein family)
VSILAIVVIGLVVGIIARLVVPGRDHLSMLGTLAIGVAGSLLGWWAGRALVGSHAAAHHPWLWATAGAVVVLLVVRVLTYRRRGWLGRRPVLGRRRWGW